MPNPLANKTFWWASALLASSGIALSLYAVNVTAAQWTQSVETRARQITQNIERAPQDLVPIVSTTDDQVSVYNSEGRLLATSRSVLPQNSDADLDDIKSVLQSRKPQSSTGETVSVVLPIAASGRPAAVLHLTRPAAEIRAATQFLRNRLLLVTTLFTLTGMTLVGLYLMTADRRLRQQRQFVENVLAPAKTLEFRSTNDDEISALARSLRELPPHLEGLNRQAQAELALRELILKTMSEGVVAVSRDMHVTFCNDNFNKYTAAKHSLPMGCHILTAVRSPEFLNLLTAAIRTNETHHIRIELNSRQLHVQASPLEAAGSSGAIAVLRDVTDLERLERVRRDFVTNISHELRTPLAAIQGYAETMLEGDLPADSAERRFLETIHQHATRLSRVAADLATLSEIETPSNNQPLSPVSIRMVVASAVRAVEREADSRHIKLIADDLPDVEVYGQQLRLEQAMVNLLDNAVRFTGVAGEVHVASESTTNGELRVSVTDNGIGIPSEHLGRIFERFYRVDKARSRETGGTGLGLSIVKHVAEQMHGSVQVESTLGKGTKFTLVLPLTRYHEVHGSLVERASGARSGTDAAAD